MGSKVMYVNQ